MESYQVVDADGHIKETMLGVIEWEKEIDPKFKHIAPKVLPFYTRGGRTLMDGKLWPRPFLDVEDYYVQGERFAIAMNRKGMWEPEERVRDMDREGIHTAILFGDAIALGIPGVRDPNYALAISRVYNRWASKYAQTSPSRLKPVAALPLQDPDIAASELEFCVGELGMIGVCAAPMVQGRTLADSRFFPVYASCERLGVPICVHGNCGMHGLGPPGLEGCEQLYLVHAASFPFGLMMAIGSLIGEGTFDKFPSLRFAFLEGGVGWLPYWMERMDGHFELMKNQMKAKNKPSEYLRSGQCFVSCDPQEATLPDVVSALGEDQIMYASDYWHGDAKYFGTVASIAENPKLSPSAKRKILGDNARRLFRLDTASE